MSLNIWTQEELRSEIIDWRGVGWRIVESQSHYPTMDLVDNTVEQDSLERVLETTKPKIPIECEGLNYLLFSPFRYPPFPRDSRFRKSDSQYGVFYASECVETALHEVAFHYLLNFFTQSPDMIFPKKPRKFTAFTASFDTSRLLDLSGKKLKKYSDYWTRLEDYSYCHALVNDALDLDVQIIKYLSVRDVNQGQNLAVLSCKAFNKPNPVKWQTWELNIDSSGIEATCDFPTKKINFSKKFFARDSRLESMNWKRSKNFPS